MLCDRNIHYMTLYIIQRPARPCHTTTIPQRFLDDACARCYLCNVYIHRLGIIKLFSSYCDNTIHTKCVHSGDHLNNRMNWDITERTELHNVRKRKQRIITGTRGLRRLRATAIHFYSIEHSMFDAFTAIV